MFGLYVFIVAQVGASWGDQTTFLVVLLMLFAFSAGILYERESPHR